MALPGGDCLIIGGGDVKDRKNVYRYLAGKNELVKKSDLIDYHYQHASVALGNKVYVMSGLYDGTSPKYYCEVYDAENNKSTEIANML